MGLMGKIREADEQGDAFVQMNRSASLRNALARYRRATGSALANVTHKGACYVLFLDRIIKGEGK